MVGFLLYSSNSTEKMYTGLKGNVRSVDIIKIDGARWVLGMTDYGEVILCNDARERWQFNIENAPFRSMAMLSDNKIAAMTSDGLVVVMEFSGARNPRMNVLGTIRIGPGVWKGICTIGKNLLVAMNDNSLVWINAQLMAIKDIIDLNPGLQIRQERMKHRLSHQMEIQEDSPTTKSICDKVKFLCSHTSFSPVMLRTEIAT